MIRVETTDGSAWDEPNDAMVDGSKRKHGEEVPGVYFLRTLNAGDVIRRFGRWHTIKSLEPSEETV